MDTNYLSWSDEYCIGIHHIDQQHQVLIGMLNSLYRAMEDGDTRETLTDILLELIVYVDSHFKAEEELMEKAGFPDLPQHKEMHEELTKCVREYRTRFENEEQIEDELFQFLVSWLMNHIKRVDKKIGKYVNSQNDSP